jgi:RimJ/RimL family protein N-acetyltransferase
MELRAGDLVLRLPAERDLGAIVAACGDPEISRFIPYVPSPYTEDDARAFLADVREAWRMTPERTFAVADGERDEFLGVVTVRLREGGSVGYWLKPEARGRGVMTQAVRAVVEWACVEQGIERLVLTAHPDNVASQRVAEKAGFRRVGTTTDHPVFSDGTRNAVLFELS